MSTVITVQTNTVHQQEPYSTLCHTHHTNGSVFVTDNTVQIYNKTQHFGPQSSNRVQPDSEGYSTLPVLVTGTPYNKNSQYSTLPAQEISKTTIHTG